MELDIEILTTEKKDLLQKYANADLTCSCLGHYKGMRNSVLRESYALELRSFGIHVPKDLSEKIDVEFVSNVTIPEGVFNGEGTF